MLISFSMPVRKHYEMTIKSIQTLVDNVDDITRIEVILRLDVDDDLMLSKYDDIIKTFPKLQIKKVVGERYGGWVDNYKFHTEACEIAEGEFLQLWADDGIMMTKGFDTIINDKYSGKVCVCSWKDTGNWTCFPMISKKIFDLTCSFGKTTFCDCYLVDIGTGCDIYFYDESIYTLHDRYDLTGNNNHEEYKEQQDKYYMNAIRENNSQKVRELKQNDINIILNYLNGTNR